MAGSYTFAQENNSLNTYTPYSISGLGDIVQQGLTSTGSMAGISCGVRDVYQIDYTNPAGASARDSVMNFVLDFGGEMKNFYSKTTTKSTSYNTGNFHHLAAAFAVGRKFGVNIGITPFSEVGYEIEKREKTDSIVATAGDVRYQYRGEDGLNQVFLNLGFSPMPSLAVGVGAKYYFGTLSRYYNTVYSTNAYYYSTYSSDLLKVSNMVPVFGAQYTLNMNPKKGTRAVFGVSYQPQMKLGATENVTSTVESSVSSDTAYGFSNNVKVLMPMQLNVGASVMATDRWMLGAEFNYQDWSKTDVMGSLGDMGTSYSVKLGGYYIPNRYDVRYFLKRLTYRGGLRYSQTPYVHNGNKVNDMALTLGVSMPVRAGMLNFGAEVGRRGTTANGMIQETYLNFSFSITLLESWFRKYQYE